MKNEISVVIPTYTPDIDLLKKTLFSLRHQSIKPNIIVVVENGIGDTKTKEVVESFGCKYLFNEEVGANKARNLGASVCDDGVIFFTDDDCELKHNCLENHLSIHARGNFLVGGQVELKYLAPKPEWLVHHFELMLAKLDWSPENLLDGANLDITNERNKYLVSANLSIRTAIFEKYGGFNESDGYVGKKLLAANDEMLLLERCRISGDTKLLFSSNCLVKHNIPPDRMTEEYMHRRFYGQGVADSRSAISSPYLKLIDPPVDLTDHETIINNTLMKYTVWSDNIIQIGLKSLTGDKIKDREITRVYMTCYCQYIRGVQDFLADDVRTESP
jgi:glycosyltransferase involved in cell wall biosynthesis